jgi:hypothetical protein
MAQKKIASRKGDVLKTDKIRQSAEKQKRENERLKAELAKNGREQSKLQKHVEEQNRQLTEKLDKAQDNVREANERLANIEAERDSERQAGAQQIAQVAQTQGLTTALAALGAANNDLAARVDDTIAELGEQLAKSRTFATDEVAAINKTLAKLVKQLTEIGLLPTGTLMGDLKNGAVFIGTDDNVRVDLFTFIAALIMMKGSAVTITDKTVDTTTLSLTNLTSFFSKTGFDTTVRYTFVGQNLTSKDLEVDVGHVEETIIRRYKYTSDMAGALTRDADSKFGAGEITLPGAWKVPGSVTGKEEVPFTISTGFAPEEIEADSAGKVALPADPIDETNNEAPTAAQVHTEVGATVTASSTWYYYRVYYRIRKIGQIAIIPGWKALAQVGGFVGLSAFVGKGVGQTAALFSESITGLFTGKGTADWQKAPTAGTDTLKLDTQKDVYKNEGLA